MRTILAVVVGLLLLSSAAWGQLGGTAPLNLELRDADINSALTLLFKDSGKSYVAEQGVQGSKVTIKLIDASWDQALRLVLDAASLTYTKDDSGIYHIKARISPTTATGNIAPELSTPAAPSTPAATVSSSTAKGNYALIKLSHIDPVLLAMMFGGTVVGYGGMYGGNQGMYGNQYGGNQYGGNPYGGVTGYTGSAIGTGGYNPGYSGLRF